MGGQPKQIDIIPPSRLTPISRCGTISLMHPTLEKLLAEGTVLTDGAWGTQLQLRGLQSGECPDVWNLTHPDKVASVAQAYVDAGSRVILTNTFGANRIRLAAHHAQDKVAEINKAGVEISRRAANGKALVFASLGPSGKMLMTGDTSEDALKGIFTEQAVALAAGGADAIVVETMSDVAEARIAIAAAKATGLPVIVSMVFDAGKNKERTMMGLTPEMVVSELEDSGADVIGANCGQGIQGYIAVCRRMKAVTQLPLWMKANAGLPEMVQGQVVYRTTARDFADQIPALRQAGATFIGGCCGTSPDFIRLVKSVL